MKKMIFVLSEPNGDPEGGGGVLRFGFVVSIRLQRLYPYPFFRVILPENGTLYLGLPFKMQPMLTVCRFHLHE